MYILDLLRRTIKVLAAQFALWLYVRVLFGKDWKEPSNVAKVAMRRKEPWKIVHALTEIRSRGDNKMPDTCCEWTQGDEICSECKYGDRLPFALPCVECGLKHEMFEPKEESERP